MDDNGMPTSENTTLALPETSAPISGRAKYWAADQDPRQLVKKCEGFLDSWKSATGQNSQGISSTWARNVISYYSCVLEPNSWESALSYEGEQGELVKMAVPQARSLNRQQIALVTKQRMAFQCVAQDGAADVETLTAVRIGNDLCEHIVDAQHLDLKGELAAEHTTLFGMGFLMATWRTDKGMPYAVREDGGGLHYTGDLEITVPTVYDVIFDTSRKTIEDLDWILVRKLMNRYDLMAQFPALADKIEKLPNAYEQRQESSSFFMRGGEADDTVFCWEFYHVLSPSLPAGRMTMFSDANTVYHDGHNLYECLPIEAIRAESIVGTPFGYPLISNLLPSQEMLDHSLSAIATNQAATAVQSYIAPRGCELTAVDISGMNFLLYNPQGAAGGGKPEALQLTQSAPETFKFADILHSHMQQISNISGALRGTPPPGVDSGKALNALTMNSIEFLESFRKQYSLGLERLMNKAIQFYQKFATAEMLMESVGPNQRTQVTTFKGSQLAPIKRVKTKAQSAALQTIGGRTDVADTLLQAQLIKSPQQYISLIEGAPLQELYTNELNENDLLQRERQYLLEGKEPPINKWHNHPAHVRDHANLFNDPTITGNPRLVQVIEKHIQDHILIEEQQSPIEKAMSRTGMAPPMPPPGPPVPNGAPPPGPGGPPPGPVGPPPGGGGAPPQPHQGPPPVMPQMPHVHAPPPGNPQALSNATEQPMINPSNRFSGRG